METLDNGTMVEVFKCLNYCELAKNSLVSKRFRNVIKTHRYKLALLYVDNIFMRRFNRHSFPIKIFDKKLSPDAYNEWIIRNNYSNHVSIEDQDATTQSIQNVPIGYWLGADAYYKDSNYRKREDTTSVLFAIVELNSENWPVFQHFVCLIRDQFVYIRSMDLTPQNDVFFLLLHFYNFTLSNMLASAINSDHDLLKCEEFTFKLNDNSQKFITWAKKHVRCNQFYIDGKANLNQDEAFLDFVMTGAHCTKSIIVKSRELSKAIVYFVQKFLDLKNWDEYKGVQSISGYHLVENQDIQIVKNDYAKFIVKEEHDEVGTTYVFEFVNNAIGKQLQLTASILFDVDDYMDYSDFPSFLVKVKDL